MTTDFKHTDDLIKRISCDSEKRSLLGPLAADWNELTTPGITPEDREHLIIGMCNSAMICNTHAVELLKLIGDPHNTGCNWGQIIEQGAPDWNIWQNSPNYAIQRSTLML